MKKGVASSGIRHDIEKRTLAVADYRLSGNISAVSSKYGIARTTLMRWINEFEATAPDSEDKAAVVDIIKETTAAHVRSIEADTATRQAFLAQHYREVGELFSALIGKMQAELADETKHPSLRDQAAALTALTNFVKEFTPQDETQGQVNINLLQQTVNR